MAMIFKTIRWCVFVLVALIQAGAFLEQEWITWVTGLILAMFLTVEPSAVKERTKMSYGFVLTVLVVLFLAGSIIDMSNGYSGA